MAVIIRGLERHSSIRTSLPAAREHRGGYFQLTNLNSALIYYLGWIKSLQLKKVPVDC